ncbi:MULTISPECIES: acyl-CoA thioesterase [unclassified Modestobacter]|uniref:acyl-CoA thioesterase n=1 Tax=unclassified Modestobacter TaxID=2643866 RepID=UPI0022AA6EBD|nr:MULTISPECIES: acyl-CoA thioesterase domain-containing protein [unclassified Modestobacter]MCZ2812906.1 thioesterase family protein [Modestobacter sp. VKM Ac-2979]MCZ2843065.1 thioesterase family protein [Modestobacter sp. VKM Ac-2980]MCZ2847672.1 thioesterase family protein [Modestobacter sp. VKM Ac-2978]
MTAGVAQPGETPAAELMVVLDLEERGPDVYVGQTPSTPLQRIFGGQVAAQALTAANATVGPGRVVHSLHSYFLRPGDPHEEIRYEVDRIREGRSFSTRRVVARQTRKGEDVAIFALTADFTAGERAVVEHSLPMPEVPGPEGLPGLAEVTAAHPGQGAASAAIGRAVEQRYLADPFDPQPRLPPDTAFRVWFRVAGRLPDDDAVHAAALTFVSDLTLLSAGLARTGGGWGGSIVGASLDHAVWFHRPVRADEWFLYETDSPAAASGRALCFGQIWAADGTHVATVAQEGLIRSLG